MSTTMTTPIDLAPFCARYDDSHFPQNPFVFNGYKYATDGRICVRIPATGERDSADVVREAVESVADVEGEFLPWPASDPVQSMQDCEACRARGFIGGEDCKACDGTGTIECKHCGNDSECEDCDGEGHRGQKVSCAACGGKGQSERFARQLIGSTWIKYEYDRLVRALPNPTFREIIFRGKTDAVAFRFDGGIGFVAAVLV